jgi:hypothetical protein
VAADADVAGLWQLALDAAPELMGRVVHFTDDGRVTPSSRRSGPRPGSRVHRRFVRVSSKRSLHSAPRPVSRPYPPANRSSPMSSSTPCLIPR